jgi:predicted ATPase
VTRGSVFVKRISLKRESVSSFEQYPFHVPAVRGLHDLELTAAVTFFVGENGSGKSTLLEAIAVASGFNAEGGTRNFRFATRATHSELHQYLRLTRSPGRPTDGYFFLRAESFYNVASAAEAYGVEWQHGGGRSPHEQSHGESFLALVLHRLHGNGLYLFDEPEAALSPTRQLSLLVAMQQLVKAKSQFIIATHSPILLGYPGAKIHEFGEDGIRAVEYTDTEHYTVTKAFLEPPSACWPNCSTRTRRVQAAARPNPLMQATNANGPRLRARSRSDGGQWNVSSLRSFAAD